MLLDKKLPSLKQKLYGGKARATVKDEPKKVAKTPKVEKEEKSSKKSKKSKRK